ncbi:MAG TPA: glycosyltransferase [Anaerolineae bacterium]|nr:glycosyltransferase [Anaerolineae bacterium]
MPGLCDLRDRRVGPEGPSQGQTGGRFPMKILVVSQWFPYPPDNGARLRTYHLLKHLARRHEIVLLSFTRREVLPEHVEAVRAYCAAVETAPFRPFHPARLRALMGLFLPRPRALTDTYSPQMEALVRETLHRERFDLVLASTIGPTAATAMYVRGHRGLPRVLEDLELSVIADRIRNERNRLQRRRLRLTWWKLRRFTAGLLRDLDGCTVASERERDLVRRLVPGYRHLAVVPNGLEPERYEGDFGPPEPDALVFPGSLTYCANRLAMEFFLKQIMPRIVARRPGVRLFITGQTEEVDLARIPLSNNVVLTGYLDDVRPRIARSKICVVPILTGGGTRLKVLEAMALGVPVVATAKGAEGLEVRPEEDILLADGPEAFAAQVIRLLEDPALHERLARNGRRLVRERYDWREIGQRFEAFLEQVVVEWNDVDIS